MSIIIDQSEYDRLIWADKALAKERLEAFNLRGKANEMIKLIRTYARHLPTCAVIEDQHNPSPTCTCGYTNALALCGLETR